MGSYEGRLLRRLHSARLAVRGCFVGAPKAHLLAMTRQFIYLEGRLLRPDKSGLAICLLRVITFYHFIGLMSYEIYPTDN